MSKLSKAFAFTVLVAGLFWASPNFAQSSEEMDRIRSVRQSLDGDTLHLVVETEHAAPQASAYYLSMRVSYPNASDRILKAGKSAGGAIMVHGNCVTIGCIPITDEYIKELYILCLDAQNRH